MRRLVTLGAKRDRLVGVVTREDLDRALAGPFDGILDAPIGLTRGEDLPRTGDIAETGSNVDDAAQGRVLPPGRRSGC